MIKFTGNTALYTAGKISKLKGKAETRPYCKYLTVQNGTAYSTDSRVLISFPLDAPDGFYAFVTNSKKQTVIEHIGPVDDMAPDFEKALQTDGRPHCTIDFTLCTVFDIYDLSGARLQAKYVGLLGECFYTCQMYCGGSLDAVILINGDVRAVIMPVRDPDEGDQL